MTYTCPSFSLRFLLSISLVSTYAIFIDATPAKAGVTCEDFGCVKVELTYDGGRRMAYSVFAYNFRRGHIIADGDVYDSSNQVYIDILAKTCSETTECLNAGHFSYPNRCDGQVFELIGSGHRREDPQTAVVIDRDAEAAPIQSGAVMAQEDCQR